MSSSRCLRVEELAWKMWRVADVPNDKGLQLATLESLCQYLAGHLPYISLCYIFFDAKLTQKLQSILC